MAVHQGELFGERSSRLPAFRFGMGTVEAISAASRHRIRANRFADTNPLSAYQCAERRIASTAGRERYPSSSLARASSKIMRVVAMRAPSSGTVGSRCRRRPSTKCEASAAASAARRGTLIAARGRPVAAARTSRICTELEVLTPEHVAAALAPPLGGEQVAGGDVIHVDDVQRRVEPPRDAPVQEVEHRLACRRGRPVARTERQRRLHEDRRQSLRRCT